MQWKIEYTTPIGKIPNPEDEDDLRPISLTPFFSKVMEHFVVTWLMEIIGEKIDFRQYGGIKGNSISHYLIELLNFILFNQDKTEPTALLACLIDFSKVLNRQNHNLLVTKLSDMGVPSWLLRLVIAFLKDRSMVIRYKGASSKQLPLPEGGPQGTLLGLLLFLVLVNDVGFDNQMNEVGEVITSKRRLKELNEIHLKYVDDLTIAETINMKEQLGYKPPEHRPLPDNFHARTGHYLTPQKSRVYNQLLKTKEYATENEMKLNTKKTKLILFNPGWARDFIPEFSVDGSEIEVVEEIKLLGVVLSNDLSWSANIDYMTKRCNKKLWIIRRLKKIGVDREDLKDIYIKQIRSILEFAVPVWHPSLKGEQRLELERIQKSALHIILTDDYRSYRTALKTMNMESLFTRRQRLCKKCARKSVKNVKFSKWFKLNSERTKTRFEQPKYCPTVCRTERFAESPISYLTNLLNEEAARC